MYSTGDGHLICCPGRIPVKKEVSLKHVVQSQSEAGRDEMGVQYEPGGRGEERPISGASGRGYMMETKGSEKERPDGGQGSGDVHDAPHGSPFGDNLKPQPVLLSSPSRFSSGIGLCIAKPGKGPLSARDAVVSAQAMYQCESAEALVHLLK